MKYENVCEFDKVGEICLERFLEEIKRSISCTGNLFIWVEVDLCKNPRVSAV